MANSREVHNRMFRNIIGINLKDAGITETLPDYKKKGNLKTSASELEVAFRNIVSIQKLHKVRMISTVYIN